MKVRPHSYALRGSVCAALLLCGLFSWADVIDPIAGFETPGVTPGGQCYADYQEACFGWPNYQHNTGNPSDSEYCPHPTNGACGFIDGSSNCSIVTTAPGCSTACPEGYVYDEGLNKCRSECDWPEVWDAIGQTCSMYEDCPAGQVPDPENEFQCMPAPCNEGDTAIVHYGPYWVHHAGQINIDVPGSICVGVCEYVVQESEIKETWPGSQCATINTSTQCQVPAGYSLGLAGVANGESCAGDTPAPPCPTCVGPPDPEANPNAPQHEPTTIDPEGTTPNLEITEETTVTENPDGSTTTVTVRTFPDGSTETTTTTTQPDGSSESHTVATPGQAQEGREQFGGRNCETTPLCQGDPIQCAIARFAHQADCREQEREQGISDALDEWGEAGQAEVNAAAGIGEGEFDEWLAGDEIDVGEMMEQAGSDTTAACPSDIESGSLNTPFGDLGSVVIPMQPLCDFSDFVRPIILAGAWFSVGLIYYRGLLGGSA